MLSQLAAFSPIKFPRHQTLSNVSVLQQCIARDREVCICIYLQHLPMDLSTRKHVMNQALPLLRCWLVRSYCEYRGCGGADGQRPPMTANDSDIKVSRPALVKWPNDVKTAQCPVLDGPQAPLTASRPGAGSWTGSGASRISRSEPQSSETDALQLPPDGTDSF